MMDARVEDTNSNRIIHKLFLWTNFRCSASAAMTNQLNSNPKPSSFGNVVSLVRFV